MNSRSSLKSAAAKIRKDAAAIAAAVLGKDYELSLVFCGNAVSQRLNRTYRGKDEPTNVLAFPLSEKSGEIFINLSKLKGFSPEFLFIHGLLHLKGLEHGATMEREEQRLLKLFFNGAPSLSRDRSRHTKRKGNNRRRGRE